MCVNYVRNSAMKHRIFKELCNEMGPEFEVLLYHSNIQWLSRFCESTNIVMSIASKF